MHIQGSDNINLMGQDSSSSGSQGDGFAKHLRQFLKRNPRVTKVLHDRYRGVMVVTIDDEWKNTLDLAIGEGEFDNAGNIDREVIVARWAQMAVASELPANLSAAAEHIMPLVRSNDLPSLVALRAGHLPTDTAGEFVWRPLCEGLAIFYVFDQTGRMGYVLGNQLDRWGIGRDDLHHIALRNLAQKTLGTPQRTKSGIWRAIFRDNYDSSRVLLPHWLDEVPLAGKKLVVIPTREHLLLGGPEHAPVLMSEAEQAFTSRPRSISCRVFFWQQGDLQPWSTVPGDPLHLCRERSERIDLGQRYAEQKELLCHVYETQKVEVRVASLLVFEDEDRGVYSLCVWLKGMTNCLPLADYIAITVEAEDPEKLVVRWSDVLEVCESRICKVPALLPPRWLCSDFPDRHELAKLQARAVKL